MSSSAGGGGGRRERNAEMGTTTYPSFFNINTCSWHRHTHRMCRYKTFLSTYPVEMFIASTYNADMSIEH